MDSARARTVGSSSTTRTVVGLAFSDVIRPSPLALKRQPWGKSEVPTLAVILQFRFHLLRLCSKNSDAEAATDYKLAVRAYRGVSHNMHRAACFRHQADRVRRSARAHTQHETKALLLAQDYDVIAEDLENGRYRSCIPRCCRSAIVNARVG